MTAKVCQVTEIPVKIISVLKKLFFVVILAIIPLVVFYSDEIVTMIGRAAAVKANIIVDTAAIGAEFRPIWANFAQGGEEPPPMLKGTVDKMKELKPRYIRLDHIYDKYQIVKKSGSQISYDFSLLDKSVEDILNMGAKPFFSLSYMPIEFSGASSVIDLPTDLNLWSNLVRETILHYSGQNNLNLSDVYYEVWNEPELPQFGKFSPSGKKSYRDLYLASEKGAREVLGANRFFFGGPAVGSYYPEWIEMMAFLKSQKGIRLDFYSWHRYHQDPAVFLKDVGKTRNILKKYNLVDLPLIISEWGIDSEKNEAGNTDKAAAHAAATALVLANNLEGIFNFEVKDGPPPDGGRWGLLTHELNNQPLEPKKRYQVFRSLNKLTGLQINTSGDGTFVKALGVKNKNSEIEILLVNYDRQEKNTENVPLTFTGLKPGDYSLTVTDVVRDLKITSEIPSVNGTIQKSFPMLPNAVLNISLVKKNELARFIPGYNGGSDTALLLNNQNQALTIPLTLKPAQNNELEIMLKPSWPEDDKPLLIMDIPLKTNDADSSQTKISLEKRTTRNIDFLAVSVYDGLSTETLTLPLNFRAAGSDWQIIRLAWSAAAISISVGGGSNQITFEKEFKASLPSSLIFYPFGGAIDNLSVKADGEVVLTRTFDGSIGI